MSGRLYVGSTLVGGTLLSGRSSASGSWELTVTSGSTAHTPGAWTEVVASAPGATQWVTIQMRGSTGGNNIGSATLLDIAIGASGSETAVVSSIPIGYRVGSGNISTIVADFPAIIPSGSRISIRIASAVTSWPLSVTFSTWVRPGVTASAVALGANTAASQGVATTSGTAAWQEITASCPAALCGVLLGPQLNGATSNVQGVKHLLDVGVGASGSEVAVASGWPVTVTTSETLFAHLSPLVGCNIPAGARVSVRRSGATTGPLDMILMGVPA